MPASAPGGGRGQPPGEVVRLGAGVDEEHRVEPVRHRRHQALCRARRRARAGSACSCSARPPGARSLARPAGGRGRPPERCCRRRGSVGRRRPPSRRRRRARGAAASGTTATRARCRGPVDVARADPHRRALADRRPRAVPPSVATPRRSRSPPSARAAPTPAPAQPRMYSLSGCCGMRQAEMRIVCAIRPASRSPSSAASASSSGSDRCVSRQEGLGHREQVGPTADE